MNLFDTIPNGFFNYLASGSNNRIYSDCLEVIYKQYDREVSYRIKRSVIRNAVAVYLMDNHENIFDDEMNDDIQKSNRSYNDYASDIIRRFCAKDTGWLEEENDDETYEKNIIMTEHGITLAEFLIQLKKPEKEEFSGYILNIYNTLNNEEQWINDPYVMALKRIHSDSKRLAKALKKLSTFIKRIIEKMVREESLESLTENILAYCEGDFIKEYSRLTKEQNIHIYRRFIKEQLGLV